MTLVWKTPNLLHFIMWTELEEMHTSCISLLRLPWMVSLVAQRVLCEEEEAKWLPYEKEEAEAVPSENEKAWAHIREDNPNFVFSFWYSFGQTFICPFYFSI